MRTIEIMFRTNYKNANYNNANYNYKFDITCVDVDDLRHAKNAINDYIEKMIDKEMQITQNYHTDNT